MPKDSHMLPAWSQTLLRAARRGQVVKAPAAPVEEDKELGEDEDGEGDIEPGFVATKWGLVPSHLEGRENKFLADRRPGLPSLYEGGPGTTAGFGLMRKVKIRRLDGEGHASILEVHVPEGQTVDGEIVEEDTTLSQAPAPGTVVEGVGVVNADGVVIAGDQVQPTPPRRRPPPPKRRPKGPGRGRKKKVAFAPGPEGAPISQGTNLYPGAANAQNGGSDSVTGDRSTADGDVEMGEGSVLQDGEEGSEDEDDADEGDDGDREEGELSPTPMSVSKSPSREPPPQQTTEDHEAPVASPITPPPAPDMEPSSSPDLPFADGQSSKTSLPQVDTAQEAIEIPQTYVEPPIIHIEAPSMDVGPIPEINFGGQQPLSDLPETSRTHVEESPQSTSTAVELPPEHNPLEGLAEPQVPITENEASVTKPQAPAIESQVPLVEAQIPVARPDSTDSALHFPDGEEDLLGSLERHLDKQN